MPAVRGANLKKGALNSDRNKKKDGTGLFCKGSKKKSLSNLTPGNKRIKQKIPARDNENVKKLSHIVPGRRIVQLAHLAKQLRCDNCHKEILIQNIVDESRCGFSSVLTIKCENCNFLKRATTNTTQTSANGRPLPNINKKAVLGMIDAGIGPTHLNALVTTMNIPPMDASTVRRYERLVGPAIESVARQSCFEAALTEKHLTEARQRQASKKVKAVDTPGAGQSEVDPLSSQGDCTESSMTEVLTGERDVSPTTSMAPTPSPPAMCSTPATDKEGVNDDSTSPMTSELLFRKKTQNFTKVTGDTDMGWQKRGNGFCYDSSSGHSSLVGELSGLVMDYEVKRKLCSKCSKRGGVCGEEDCRRNWTGSSKSMEAAAAVRMVTNSASLDAAGVCVGTLVGDEDSSTTAALRKAVGTSVYRGSDIMHSAKIIKNDLYALNKLHSGLNRGAIKYIVALAGCAIKSNKNEPEKIAAALKSIPEHVFQNHSSCGDWCQYSANPSAYKQKYLKKSLGVHGDTLYKSICNVFNKVAKKAHQLAPCGSTQKNEAVNHVIASKAPKVRHYGGSQSLNYRVAAAVNQTNIGTSYVVNVNKALLVSPGRHSKSYKLKLERKRKREAEERKRPETKKRRKMLIERRHTRLQSIEDKEGVTYRSGLGFENNIAQTPLVEKKKKTPCHSYPLSKLPPVKERDVSLVYFDLETTGFDTQYHDIMQIAAHSQEHGNFSKYMKPASLIPRKITEITNMSLKRGKLCYQNKPVEVVPLGIALLDFLQFINMHKNPVLVAHNAQFDLRFLLYSMEKLKMTNQLEEKVLGAIDTLSILRKMFPKKKNPQLENHKLETLAKFVLGEQFKFAAHNATDDCLALKAMVEKLELTMANMVKSSFTITSFLVRAEEMARFKQMLPLTVSGVAPKQISKLARTNWSLQKLHQHCTEGDPKNLEGLLLPLLESDTVSVVEGIFQWYNQQSHTT